MLQFKLIALLLCLSIGSAQAALPLPPTDSTKEVVPNSTVNDRLHQLQNKMEVERAAIVNSSSSLEECDQRYQAWLATPRPEEESNYIIEQTRNACAAIPPDWSRLNRCLDLLAKGVQHPEVVALIESFVTPHESDICQSPDTKYLFKAIETLGWQDSPKARVLLSHWVDAATWNTAPIPLPDCDTRYLRVHLRRAALYGIGKQPPRQALPLLRQLQARLNASGEDNIDAERGLDLRNEVRILIEDVTLRQKGEPPRHPSLRGYNYYGPGAEIVP